MMEKTKCADIDHETPGVIVEDSTGSYCVSFSRYDGICIVTRCTSLES